MTFIVLLTTSPAYAQVSNFFWSEDDGTGEVFTADSAGQNVAQVTSGGFARIDDVEIDPLAGKLWWNNWVPGSPAAAEDIYNSNLDGSGQVSLGLVSSCGGPPSGLTGMVLDPANLRLFYTRGVSYNNCPNGEVSRVNMDGSGYTQLDNTPGGDSWHPDGIELSGNTVFWANPGFFTGIAGGPVNSMDTNGGNQQINLLPNILGDGRSVAIDAAKGLLFYSSHGLQGPGGSPGARATGGEIFVVDLTNIGAGATNVFSDPNTGIPDVELDVANMRLYWTDYANGRIDSASYDAAGNLGQITNEISNLVNPYGLALDFQQQQIGGTLIPIDTTTLLLAGVQSISMWMIPVVAAGIGIGIFVIKRRK